MDLKELANHMNIRETEQGLAIERLCVRLLVLGQTLQHNSHGQVVIDVCVSLSLEK